MASPLRAACRASSRLVTSRTSARGLTTSARCLAAQNFTMPALSPTMTEGNIATWKVSEGDKFSAGDVLLEIETDKATMDVEAQEDGVMVKIMAQGGSKAVQVGTRIAVMAEAEDDIGSLEIPPDAQPKQEAKEASSQESTESSQQSAPEPVKKSGGAQKASGGGEHEHKYPLLPSVEQLIKEKGLGREDVSKIKPTGPKGQLLKGDVLAYVGSINVDLPGSLASRFDKLSHLDLSNIKVAPKKEEVASQESTSEEPAAPEVDAVEIHMPISFTKVIDVQKRIKDTLNVFLPLSTFINRAAEAANDDLPFATRQPSADELFDQVLGLDKIKAAKGSRGVYLPQISAIPPASMLAPRRASSRPTDIIDVLAASKTQSSLDMGIPTMPGSSSGDNVFSLLVPKAEEQRAQMFLERCKMILEQEPGRLVL